MSTRLRYLTALATSLAASLVAAVVAGQETAGTRRFGWRPRLPIQGSLVVLALRAAAGDSVTAVWGELAGEPLHFELVADEWHAVGGVPLDTHDSVAARVVIAREGGALDTVIAALPVRLRRAARERLQVASRFAQPPESLAERIGDERELVREVRQQAHGTPRLWREAFVRPSAGAVTSGFGVSRVFNGVTRSRHLGVDFAARLGAPVRAANRGVVALVADLFFSGTTVLVDHGAGLVTGYFHLSRALVAPGDTIDRGQLIGRVGSSGRATKPHLHWFAAYGYITVDPLDLVRLNITAPLERR